MSSEIHNFPTQNGRQFLDLYDALLRDWDNLRQFASVLSPVSPISAYLLERIKPKAPEFPLYAPDLDTTYDVVGLHEVLDYVMQMRGLLKLMLTNSAIQLEDSKFNAPNEGAIKSNFNEATPPIVLEKIKALLDHTLKFADILVREDNFGVFYRDGKNFHIVYPPDSFANADKAKTMTAQMMIALNIARQAQDRDFINRLMDQALTTENQIDQTEIKKETSHLYIKDMLAIFNQNTEHDLICAAKIAAFLEHMPAEMIVPSEIISIMEEMHPELLALNKPFTAAAFQKSLKQIQARLVVVPENSAPHVEQAAKSAKILTFPPR